MTDALSAKLFRTKFLLRRSYTLDNFQLEAMDVLDSDRSVLVAAPTGSGKTVVAEYGLERSLERGRRCFYTTPLKALSNQKYRDFAIAYGPDQVGLLTGDTTHNRTAPIVVMTTEVLRNMIYADPAQLHDLDCVVLDEVHYLEDRYRGSVWEEIILSAPPDVTLICLSATASNAEQLASWIANVRGAAGAVIEENRPIALENLYVVGDRSAHHIEIFPTFVNGKINKTALSLMGADVRGRQHHVGRIPARGSTTARSRFYRPRRSDVVEQFAKEGFLPAIYFVFSRAGCDTAMRLCIEDGLRLTTADEREEIRAIADIHLESMSDADLQVLDYQRFMHGLEMGIGVHHAGLVPPFREAVEEMFSKALLKVVFATETLALGVNMPARSVIIEELSKFGGDGHRELTAGEYTQLTGRAGRRGLDPIGYAAVLWSGFYTFEDVAALASARTRALQSSFRPTYNMVVNLVRRYEKDEAYRLVGSSFAQYLSSKPLQSQLDAVVQLLESRGYVDAWEITDAGQSLAGIYHDCDLLICEALRAGLLDGLSAPELAAVISCMTYEARRRGERGVLPSTDSTERFVLIEELGESLRSQERTKGLPRTRTLDPGFARLAFNWARGMDLRQVLVGARTPARTRHVRSHGAQEMSGGDFVRNVRQLVELLRQVANVAPNPGTAHVARKAVDGLVRGVIEASARSILFEDDEEVEVSDDPR